MPSLETHDLFRGLTENQRKALKAPSRITLIRAGPGTGKTRVFVAEFGRRLAEWECRKSGIAALSFTNVAQEEIAKRLGGAPGPPHFVGTLDSFLWRFVVRPFGHLIGANQNGVRLLAAPLDEYCRSPIFQYGSATNEKTSLFRIVLQGRDPNKLRAHARLSHGRSVKLDRAHTIALLETKNREWAGRGRMNHSDSHYAAAKILTGEHGPAVAEVIARRFPVLLLDEFQDTNWFLGRAVIGLLSRTGTTALAVGDRDQSIFGFSGADAKLFDKVEALDGASSRPLRVTHRFGSNVAKIATHLARSGEAVSPLVSSFPGQAIILTHSQSSPSMSLRTRERIQELLLAGSCDDAAFLCRRVAWLKKAGGHVNPSSCPFDKGIGAQLHDAVLRLRNHESAKAASIIASYLGALVLENDTPTSEDLESAGISQIAWRGALRGILFSAAEVREDETWNGWFERMKVKFGEAAEQLKGSLNKKKLGAKFRRKAKRSHNKVRELPSAVVTPPPWEALTIHGSKGRDFDGVVVYWPKPNHRYPCASEQWWSSEEDSEERELAYVAITRAKKLVVLCVHDETLANLRTHHSDFVDLFTVAG